MSKKKQKITVLISIVIIALLVCFHPLLFKKNHIAKITRIDIPRSCEIIDYSPSFDGLFGFSLNYAKIEVDKNTYDSINTIVQSELEAPWQHYAMKNDHKSLNLNDVEEMKCGEEIGSKVSLLGGATTRSTYYIAVKDETEKCYIYVFSN